MKQTPQHRFARTYFTIGDLPVFALRVPQTSFALHDHDFSEIALMLEGNAVHEMYGTRYKISAGDILIIPVHQTHAYHCKEEMVILNVLFDQRYLDKHTFDLPKLDGYQRLFSENALPPSSAGRQGCLSIPPAQFATVADLLNAFISEIESKRPGYKAIALSLFVQAIAILVRCTEHIDTPPLLLSSIQQSLEFIEAHYSEDISLDRLARLACMSQSSYQRSFRKVMSRSPIDHLVRLRIRKASALLLYNRDLNVTDIAFRVGFSDSNYFTRIFKKITGYSPREFRRSMQKTDSWED